MLIWVNPLQTYKDRQCGISKASCGAYRHMGTLRSYRKRPAPPPPQRSTSTCILRGAVRRLDGPLGRWSGILKEARDAAVRT
jgi:hypothetical protein